MRMLLKFRHHGDRERRLYSVVLAHTVVGSAFYKELEDEYANQGRLACLRVNQAHYLEMDEHVVAKMENDLDCHVCCFIEAQDTVLTHH